MSSGDALIRANSARTEIPDLGAPAFTQPPPLQEATVAVVTSAGLQRPGEDIWQANEQNFRTFERTERNLTISHLSNNFDRSGLVADLNVVFPLDRLEEMAADGTIGSVAPQHLSFMGALQDGMSTLIQDTGPAAAEQLKAAGTDVVLLTPV